MKAWTVSLAIFLLVTTAEGQMRSGRAPSHGQEVFRGVNQGFRPSPGMRPTFGRFPRQNLLIAPQVPFYPYSYYPDPYYPQPAYSTPEQSSNDAQISSLTDQIQRLENEVQRLQDELAVTRAQQAPPSPLQVSPQTPAPPVTPTVLVFRDGHKIEIQGYAIVGQTLWTTYQDGFQKIALSDLNLEATRKDNLQRGLNFLPQR